MGADGIPQRRKAGWWGAGGAGKGEARAPHEEEKQVGGMPKSRQHSGRGHPTKKKSKVVGCRRAGRIVLEDTPRSAKEACRVL